MAFDFPNAPTNGQQVTGNNGAVYTWSGTAWVTSPTAQTFVSKAGDTMQGPLTLSGNAASALQAVPLQQLGSVSNPALNDVGRNLIHNPLFNVQQRGAGPFTSGFTADRWPIITAGSDTYSATILGLADADRTAIGDESARFALQTAVTGSANGETYVRQGIETLRRLAGKTVTVSFWAKAASGTPKIGVNYVQIYGTGGSPSANTWGTAQTVTISASWARYTITLAILSAAGKTTGTNNDDSTWLTLFLSAGASAPDYVNSGSIGVQSGTVQLWGVQLEIGSVATPLEKPDPQQDLAKCQRFYQIGGFYVGGYQGVAGNGVLATQMFPVTMRAVPTMTATGVSTTNCTGLLQFPTADKFTPYATATAVGSVLYSGGFTASADL